MSAIQSYETIISNNDYIPKLAAKLPIITPVPIEPIVPPEPISAVERAVVLRNKVTIRIQLLRNAINHHKSIGKCCCLITL